MELNEDGTVRISQEESEELEQDWLWMYGDLAKHIC